MKIFKTAEPPKSLTGAQKIKLAEQEAELDEIRRAAAFAREQQEFERDQWRTSASQTAKVKEKTTKARDRAAWIRKITPYVPLVLVNATAMIFQFSWAQDHLTQFGDTKTSLARLAAAIMFAITVESIALVLQYHANLALQNGDSAAMLYLAAFTVAGLIAYVNYSHYAVPVHDQLVPSPTPMAIVAALCSLVSPWLWRIDARAKHRAELRAAGVIDARAVRLSLVRKIFHPYRSVGTISLAAWTGETVPAEAVRQWEEYQAAKKEAKLVQRANKQRAKAAERDAKARTKGAKDVPAPRTTEAPVPARTNGQDLTNSTPKRQKLNRTGAPHGSNHRDHPMYARGVELYRKSKAAPGRTISQRDLAAELKMQNRTLASKIMADVDREDGNDVKINNVLAHA